MRACLHILPVVAMILGASAGCSGRGTVEVRIGATSQAATTTPANPEAVEDRTLAVTVSRIDVHVVESGANEKGAEEGATSNGWITIFEGEQPIDLFDPRAVDTVLGESEVPAGKVTQVRLVLANDAVLVDSLGSRPIACPSCAATGIKVVTAGDVEVDSGGVLRLKLDFDADASLVEAGGGLVLKPVVRVESEVE